ncbi:MAG TPA: CvpA family protein [Pyrinomonadaceae bacterium]|nr:CvpA family protein [Pyrinomonadaceae bacterium]
MTFFDLVVLALIGSSLVAGALRGFLRALIATVAMFIGVFVAARGYETVGTLLRAFNLVESNAAANAWGFLLIVGLTLAFGVAAGQLLKGSLKRARLEWMDRALGALFGFARGMLVCCVIYLALTAFPVRLETVAEARTAPALAEGAKLLAWLTSTDVRTRFESEYRRLTS